MDNKIGHRYHNTRTRLETVIPMDTPMILFVDPSSACNLSCKFCPCGGGNKEAWANDKKTGVLSYELYREIIDGLAGFPKKLKVLRLYKEGEPLINKHLSDMIHYARKKDVAEQIDFTTNGTLLDHNLNFALLDAGVTRINISVEALDDQGYLEVSGVKIDFRKFLGNLKHLYKHRGDCHIFVKISDYGLNGRPEKDFYDMFQDISDEMSVEYITPVWPEFELQKVKSHGEHDIYGGKMNRREPVQVCPYLFYALCVNSDGTVSACLMDWNHRLIVGDASKNSIPDIWNGKNMDEMRREHLLLNKNKYAPCSKCGQLEYAVLDNIDPYREKLLENMGYEKI